MNESARVDSERLCSNCTVGAKDPLTTEDDSFSGYVGDGGSRCRGNTSGYCDGGPVTHLFDQPLWMRRKTPFHRKARTQVRAFTIAIKIVGTPVLGCPEEFGK